MSSAPTAAGIQLRAESALLRALVRGRDETMTQTGEGVLTLAHRPSGLEFMVEIRVLPMGKADGRGD